MADQLASIVFWLIVLVPIGVFVRQMRQIRSGTQRRSKGIVLFFSCSLLPILVYVLVFFTLVGIEELTEFALISEGVSRTLFLVIGIGLGEVLLLTVIFAIAASFLRPVGNDA